MKKRFLYILICWCHAETFAQQIVFPYEFKQGCKVNFSANGEMIGVLDPASEFPVFNMVEAQTGHLLAKLTLDYTEVFAFKPSFTGEYIAFIGVKENDIYLTFYIYKDVHQIGFVNRIKLSDDFEGFGEGDYELIASFNDDFYLKISD